MENFKGTITRRADTVLNGLEKEFEALYDKGDFDAKIAKLKKAKPSEIPSIRTELYKMFDVCEIKYEKDRSIGYYEKLVDESDVISDFGIENKFIQAIGKRYREYASPEDYMKRMVDKLCNPEDGWQEDTLHLRILKQFIKYGNYLSDAGCGGESQIRKYIKEKTGKNKVSDKDVLDNLDDGIFALIVEGNGVTKQQKSFDGKFGLLKVADDLATGKFRANGATKKNLYLFAMVFNMTYFSGDVISNKIHNADTNDVNNTYKREPDMSELDIEKNLFRDYYANNVLRFISDDYKGKLGQFEAAPSEQGINYKNFAEMIYLYYISKDCSPQDKVKLSFEMIERVKKRQKENSQPVSKNTKGRLAIENILKMKIYLARMY